MTGAALQALSPWLAVTGGTLALLLAISFARNHLLALGVTLATLIAALAAAPVSNAAGAMSIDGFLAIDGYANFFNALFALAAIASALLGYRYLEQRVAAAHREEFYVLLLIATLGAMTTAGAANFAAFVLGLEVLSISLYALIAYPDEGQPPLEAALKYLVLSGVASTVLLFGMALAYGASGSMAFDAAFAGHSALALGGQALILAGVGFKLSLVPFHMWTPDVYQGAPAPVTGYLATVSKGAVVALLLRYVVEAGALSAPALFLGVSIMAVASMVIGNLLALLQTNVKRILAYSSIAHIGYLLIAALLAASAGGASMALETGMVYLAGYFLMTLAAFGAMTVLSCEMGAADAESLDAYAGLFWRRPLLAATLAAAALSLAGIPLTVGFIAKFYLFAAGVEGELWALVWALVVGSAIGVYYYLRIIFAMTRMPDAEAQPAPTAPPAIAAQVDAPPPATAAASPEQEAASPDAARRLPWEGVAVVIALGLGIVALGIYPTPLIDAARNALKTFGG